MSAVAATRAILHSWLPCITIYLLFSFFFLSSVSFAQTDNDSSLTIENVVAVIAAPTSVIAEDVKYDVGENIHLHWVPSVDDQPGLDLVSGYLVFRCVNGGERSFLSKVNPGKLEYIDRETDPDSSYQYYIAAIGGTDTVFSIATQAIQPEIEYIDFSKRYLFLIAMIIGGAIIFFIETAKRGKKLYIRKIAGLEALDEAIGRATEMGRPILYIAGIQDMDNVQTLAGITILGRVSRVVADYDTKILMPVSRSLVMTAARETIKASYMSAGRPDAYSDDMVNYVTDEQFGFVAAVDGIMVREKPAACFYMGAFFAESLIMAETGNSIGAIQIAGTAMPAQLPFFVAACDFTLIGEELFAASAYLSGEPKQLGSLKGQDLGKIVAMVAIGIGVLAATGAELTDYKWIDELLRKISEIFESSG